MTSAVNVPPAIDVAVRHTPFTAIESPTDSSEVDAGAEIVKIAEVSPREIPVTFPSSVTRPVNI
jgi:hypothetical protein